MLRDGAVKCWGPEAPTVPVALPLAKAVSMGTSSPAWSCHVCIITTVTRGVACFSGTEADKTRDVDVPAAVASPVQDSVVQVRRWPLKGPHHDGCRSGMQHAASTAWCFVRVTLLCMTASFSAHACCTNSLPTLAQSQLVSGRSHICALLASGRVVCW